MGGQGGNNPWEILLVWPGRNLQKGMLTCICDLHTLVKSQDFSFYLLESASKAPQMIAGRDNECCTWFRVRWPEG